MLELIIIIMILTVLATVMSPMFFHSQESANLAKAKMEVESIAVVLRHYYSTNGGFPLYELDQQGGGKCQSILRELHKSSFIPDAEPIDPWGRLPGDVDGFMYPEDSERETVGYFIYYAGHGGLISE